MRKLLGAGLLVCVSTLLDAAFGVECGGLRLQAAQLRKSSFVESGQVQKAKPAAYDPDLQHCCTVFAGTHVQQVQSGNAGNIA